MKIVVDTNLVFSSILNSESRIAHLLHHSRGIFRFYSCDFLKKEIEKHESKLLNLTRRPISEIREIQAVIYKRIQFVPFEIVPTSIRLIAEELVSDIDENDVEFVAVAEFLSAKLWTGDKKLLNGLRQKGWPNALSTDEIFQLRQQIELKSE